MGIAPSSAFIFRVVEVFHTDALVCRLPANHISSLAVMYDKNPRAPSRCSTHVQPETELSCLLSHTDYPSVFAQAVSSFPYVVF